MQKILVTGGAGYIGSHTCLELLLKGYEILVIDNFDNSSMEAVLRVEKITGKKIDFHFGDIRDRQFLDKIFSENEIFSVIHFAGYKAVGESTEFPLMYYENNVSGSITLFEAMKEHNVKNIVFSSSATVYGDPHSVPIREDFPLKPYNPYGKTKRMIEMVLEDVYASDNSWNILLLVRDFIHVRDLALGHVKAIEKIEKNPGFFAVNLGTGKGYSVLEVLKAFEKACGKKIPYEIVARRPGDIAKCYADTGFAKEFLGWEAKYGIEKMAEDGWNWQKRNPDGYKIN